MSNRPLPPLDSFDEASRPFVKALRGDDPLARGVALEEIAPIVDDLLATGGTMNASAQLLRQCGADVRAGACIIELSFLKGRERLDMPFTSLIQYDA